MAATLRPEVFTGVAQPGAKPVVGTEMRSSLGSQSWSLSGRAEVCHAFLVLSGQGSLVIDSGQDLDLPHNTVLWVPKPMNASFRLHAGGSGLELAIPVEHAWRAIAESSVAEDLRFLMDEVVIAGENAAPMAEIAMSFQAIARESQRPVAGSISMTEFNLGLILLHLWRGLGSQTAPSTAIGGGEGIVRRFMRLVEIHYRDFLHIDSYAKELGVTRGRLQDACMRTVGKSPLTLVHERLLEEAKRKLVQSEMSIEQIAYSLGFRDAPYFNRFFTRRAGLNPGAFRRKARTSTEAGAPAGSFAAWP